MNVLAEHSQSARDVPLSPERGAALRSLTTKQLRAMVRLSGEALTPEELGYIHDICIDRLREAGDPSSEGASEVSREVMNLAIRKKA